MNEENNEKEEIRQRQDEEELRRQRQAYDTMVENGNTYIRTNGEPEVRAKIESLKIDMAVWNRIARSSVHLSLQSVELMLQVYSTMPFVLGMDILNRKEYTTACMRLSAIRNLMIKDIQEKIAKQLPDLSTPGIDSPKK